MLHVTQELRSVLLLQCFHPPGCACCTLASAQTLHAWPSPTAAEDLREVEAFDQLKSIRDMLAAEARCVLGNLGRVVLVHLVSGACFIPTQSCASVRIGL